MNQQKGVAYHKGNIEGTAERLQYLGHYRHSFNVSNIRRIGDLMAFHVVHNRPTDLVGICQRASEGLSPRHSIAALAETLEARVHDGTALSPSRTDKLIGMLTRTSPLWWAIARKVRREAASGDVIYCTGEDIGIPVITLCSRLSRVRIAMMAHYVDRPKGRFALKLFRVKHKVDLFFAVSKPQATFLQTFLRLPAERVLFLWEPTDTEFFTPGPPSSNKTCPIIVSVGLEQRDYSTLANATADLDVSVRISGYSADTKVIARAFPPKIPTNMTRRFYEWPDLVQLYRDADVVVVSLFPNNYAAGVQSMVEAMACGRPVVITSTAGLSDYLQPKGIFQIVPPGNSSAMRNAIVGLLEDSDAEKRQENCIAALARERHRFEQYIATLAAALRALQSS